MQQPSYAMWAPLSTNHTFRAGSMLHRSCTDQKAPRDWTPDFGIPAVQGLRFFTRVLATSQTRTRLRRVETRYFIRNARLVQL